MNPRPAWRCRAANGLMGTYMPSTSASPFVGPDVKGNAGRVLPVSAANGSNGKRRTLLSEVGEQSACLFVPFVENPDRTGVRGRAHQARETSGHAPFGPSPMPSRSNAPSASMDPGGLGVITLTVRVRDAAPATARVTNESSVSGFCHNVLRITMTGPAARGVMRGVMMTQWILQTSSPRRQPRRRVTSSPRIRARSSTTISQLTARSESSSQRAATASTARTRSPRSRWSAPVTIRERMDRSLLRKRCANVGLATDGAWIRAH